jgi:hypothetical protein
MASIAFCLSLLMELVALVVRDLREVVVFVEDFVDALSVDFRFAMLKQKRKKLR